MNRTTLIVVVALAGLAYFLFAGGARAAPRRRQTQETYGAKIQAMYAAGGAALGALINAIWTKDAGSPGAELAGTYGGAGTYVPDDAWFFEE